MLHKLSKYYVYIGTALAAIFTAVLVSNIIAYLLATPIPPGRPSNTGIAAAMPRGQLMMGVLERNIFNIDKEPPQIANQAGQSSAPLAQEAFSGQLKGIMLRGDLEDSFAIIATSSNDTIVLKGSTPNRGYKLKSITFDSAVVEYGGKDYALKIESSGTQIVAVTPPNNNETPPSPATSPVPAETVPSEGGTTLVAVSRSELIEQLKDQSQLVKDTALAAYYEDGKLSGYRITRLGENAPIKVLGFERGDIIKRVNGEDMTNPQPIFEMVNQIGDIDAVSIDIIRNNEKKTIFVEIQ